MESSFQACVNHYIPAILCWDNNDIQEETLSGTVQILFMFIIDGLDPEIGYKICEMTYLYHKFSKVPYSYKSNMNVYANKDVHFV